MSQKDKTKLDIISGFLGVGKTTFVNKLLHYYIDSGFRPVYIVNEFGQTGLDAEIIKADGFEAVDIFGGCICCTLRGEITGAIIKVIDTFSPSHIVFEPSGAFVFDKFSDLLEQPSLIERCELQSIVTIVDSVNFNFTKYMFHDFLHNQIQNAPVIVLSKLEKTTANIEELICDITNINPEAFVLSKVWSLWDTSDFDFLFSEQKEMLSGQNIPHHSHLQSITVKPEKPFTQDDMNRFLTCCKSENFGDLCRVKGIVKIENDLMLLNIAMQDAVLTELNGEVEPVLTFIGKKVNKKEICNFFRNIIIN